MRLMWLLLGSASLGLGGLGVVLPLLPATPFVILSAFCFARSSPVLHARLLESRIFGRAVRDWRQNRSISRRGKLASLAAMATSLALSAALGAGPAVLATQALALAGAATFVVSVRTSVEQCADGPRSCAPPRRRPAGMSSDRQA